MSFSDTKLNLSKKGYTATREAVNFLNNLYETVTFQDQHDYERVIEIGEWLMKHTPHALTTYPIPDGLETEVFGMKFPSPITVSSFKGNQDVFERYLEFGAGGGAEKTVKWEEFGGNLRSRIKKEKERVYDELKGMIKEFFSYFNRMGLPNPGAPAFVDELAESNVFSFGRPVGISIGGETVEEYVKVFNKARELEQMEFGGEKPVIYYEINASCPNTGKQQLCEGQAMFEEVIKQIRQADKDAKVFVKLSPDLKNEKLLELIDVCAENGMGINLGNTHKVVFGKDPLTGDTLYCGKSGPSLKARTLEMVKLARNHLNENGYVKEKYIPLIATGGLSNAVDVMEALEAGADLVGMASAIAENPYKAIVQTNLDLAQMLNN